MAVKNEPLCIWTLRGKEQGTVCIFCGLKQKIAENGSGQPDSGIEEY